MSLSKKVQNEVKYPLVRTIYLPVFFILVLVY